MVRNGNATGTIDFQDDDAGSADADASIDAADAGPTCTVPVGGACSAGTAGVCKRTGTVYCAAAPMATACSATPGTAVDAYQSAPSGDTTIDTSQATTSYDPHWDSNCNGQIEINASNMAGLIGNIFATGSAYNSMCAANYQAACQTLSQQQCKFGYLLADCNHNCGGVYCTPAQECGRPVTAEAQCAWQQTTSGCDYIGPGSAATFVCK
jgi:hypothetical protein